MNRRCYMHYFKYILYFLLLIIFAFSVSTDLVYAKEKMNKKCQGMDRNKDGVSSRSEWTGTIEDFNRLDDDQNGILSLEEFHERAGSDRFRELDHNNDGVISRNEWHNTSRSFEGLDLNRDGKLNRDEFYNREQVRTAVFYELDVHNDGIISHREWRSDTETFNRLDTNRDNLLSENEFYSRQSETGILIEQIFQEIFRKR